MICCVMPAAGGSIFGAIVVAVAAVYGIEWALARILWILSAAVIIAVVTVAAMVPLMRWAQRRDAVRLPLWRVREAPAQLYAEPVTELPRTERPAIAPAVINLNFYGVPADERATIIRTAIEGNEPS